MSTLDTVALINIENTIIIITLVNNEHLNRPMNYKLGQFIIMYPISTPIKPNKAVDDPTETIK